MKAVVINGHGGNEVVQVEERPRPTRGHGEVLVRVKATTLNQVDLYMRNSGAGITHSLPQIMGLDAAGVIEEVGAAETWLKVGQQVVIHPGVACGRCEFCQHGDPVLCAKMQFLGEHRDGTFAEWINVPASNVFPMPAHLSFTEAATLGVTYLTAWRMLFSKAQFKPWETTLVFGVGGGVSLAAMQLAKQAGGKVIVTSRDDDKLKQALSLGADHAINGRTQDVAKTVLSLTGGRGVDVVVENVGEAVWGAAMKSLVRGGRLVTCGATSGDQPPADLRRIFIRQLHIIGSTHGDFGEFRDLLELVSHTGLKPVIDRVYPVDQVHEALSRLESSQQFGKVCLNFNA